MARKRTKKRAAPQVSVPKAFSKVVFGVCVLLLAGFGNWFAHLPSAERAQWGRARPFLEEVGSWTCGITDSIGLTGKDAAIAYTDRLRPTPLPLGEPVIKDKQKVPDDLVVLKRLGYWAAYSPSLKHPVWVAYSIPSTKQLDQVPERPPFERDKDVQHSPKPDDYARSGYDRGHMAPNYLIATRYGKQAQKETFLMTNIVPQTPQLNREPWRILEHLIADDLSARSQQTWVITGTIPSDCSPAPKLKKGKIAIPSGFYKIVLSHHRGQLRVLAFHMTQTDDKSTRPRFTLRSVDAIEALTGFDFFPKLSDAQQMTLEAPEATRYWPRWDLF